MQTRTVTVQISLIADCADLAIVPTSGANRSYCKGFGLGRSAQSRPVDKGLQAFGRELPDGPGSAQPSVARAAVTRIRLCTRQSNPRRGPSRLSSSVAAPAPHLSLGDGRHQAEQRDCADLLAADPLTRRRSSLKVGTTKRSAQSVLCRRRHNADSGTELQPDRRSGSASLCIESHAGRLACGWRCQPAGRGFFAGVGHAGSVGVRGAAVAVGAGAAAVAAGYVGLVTGAVPIDVNFGRRLRPLGPLQVEIAAPREVVFDVIAEPYLGRQPRAIAEKIEILERGGDMVLAAHRTPLRRGLVATTVETVRFSRPDRVDFRLTRGPVPYVVEQFLLTDLEGGTRLAYTGELGTDLWALGARWGTLVAAPWQRTVAATFATVKAEAERRGQVRGERRRG